MTSMIVLSVVIGIVVAMYCVRKPTEIKYEISLDYWLMPIFVTFFALTVVFVLEIGLNQSIQYWVTTDNAFIWICLKFLDGGILAPFLCFLLSLLFGSLVKWYELDLTTLYSVQIVKIFLSIAILVHCAVLIIVLMKDYSINEHQALMNRVVIWGVTVIGMWVTLANNCIGRINQLKRNQEASKQKTEYPYCIKYYGAFFAFLAIISLIYIWGAINLEAIKIWISKIYAVMFTFSVSMLIVLLVVVFIASPSEKWSDSRLKRLIRKCGNGRMDKEGHGHYYCRVKYTILNKDDKWFVKIYERDVIYKGKEEEVKELFKEDEKPVKELDFMEIRELLQDIAESRKDYLQAQFKKCKMEYKRKLEKESV